MKQAQRIEGLTSAIFSEMNLLKAKVEARGIEIINLGIGSPDRPPAHHIQEALLKGVKKAANFAYPTSEGSPELRKAISQWYQLRFGIELDPNGEVLVLMGSQDGLAHLALAYINPGDIALIPNPGYPIYQAGIVLAGGEIYPIPLRAENGFLPDLKKIPAKVAKEAKLMLLNYPNNPVAAVATKEFFTDAVNFAREYDIIVAHDVAYSELAFAEYRPPSFLEVPGAKEIGVEFHSLSKTYNMAGCRLGFVVGNREVLEVLARIKSNIDYGVYGAVQEAGIAALLGSQDQVRQTAQTYQERRDILLDGLAGIGWQIPKPKATMFVWAPLPYGYSNSKEFAVDLLNRTGVLVIPGVAFGSEGEGYVRIALVQEASILAEAVARIQLFFEGLK